MLTDLCNAYEHLARIARNLEAVQGIKNRGKPE